MSNLFPGDDVLGTTEQGTDRAAQAVAAWVAFAAIAAGSLPRLNMVKEGQRSVRGVPHDFLRKGRLPEESFACSLVPDKGPAKNFLAG